MMKSPPVWLRSAKLISSYVPFGRYRLSSFLRSQVSKPFVTRFGEELGGAKFYCLPEDLISFEVFFTGQYEPQETLLFKSLLKPGMSFVDVGANWGYFTLMASGLVGTTGKVLSLEPDPRLFERLQLNVALNGYHHVELKQIAAADADKIVTLQGFDSGQSNHGISRLMAAPAAGSNSFEVEANTVCSVISSSGLMHVDLLKMDIEGGEVWAIPGLEPALKSRSISYVVLELHPQAIAENGSSIQECIQGFVDAEYQGYLIDHSNEITRLCAYRKKIHLKDILKPVNSDVHTSKWPHMLWVSPDAEFPGN